MSEQKTDFDPDDYFIIDCRRVFHILGRYWAVILAGIILFSGAMFAYTYFIVKPDYTATTVLYTQGEHIVDGQSLAYKRGYFIQDVICKQQDYPHEVGCTFVPRANSIFLTFTGKDPESPVEVVNKAKDYIFAQVELDQEMLDFGITDAKQPSISEVTAASAPLPQAAPSGRKIKIAASALAGFVFSMLLVFILEYQAQQRKKGQAA